jgi:hypothetical protein
MTFGIYQPGCYRLPQHIYHADPAPGPSLSRSVAHTLLEKSPRHALMEHPRLNAAHEPTHRTDFDLGSAAHTLVLGDEWRFRFIDAADYRKDHAKQSRDAARERGQIPVLPHQWDQVQAMARACRAQLDMHEDAWSAFLPEYGQAELTFLWREAGVWIRDMIDWVPTAGSGLRTVWEYKSTNASAHPNAWGKRTLYDTGAYLQSAWHREAVQNVFGWEHVRVGFVVQETAPPYAVSVIMLDPMAHAYAEGQMQRAISQWAWCLKNDRWPGYPAKTCHVELPPWKAREMEDQAPTTRDDKALLQKSIDWQAPLEAAE